MNWKEALNNYRTWYNQRVEFMEENCLEQEFWDWKVKKGYVKPEPVPLSISSKQRSEEK
jgi:hypothetical protein